MSVCLRVKSLQNVPSHTLGEFFLSKEDRANAVLAQHHRFLLAVRAQDNFDAWIEGACCVGHLAQVERIGHRHHQLGGFSNVGLNQHSRISGIARYGHLALSAQVFDQFSVLLCDNVGNAARLQCAGNPLANPPIAYQHDLSLEVLTLSAHRQFCIWVGSLLQTTSQVRAFKDTAPQTAPNSAQSRLVRLPVPGSCLPLAAAPATDPGQPG